MYPCVVFSDLSCIDHDAVVAVRRADVPAEHRSNVCSQEAQVRRIELVVVPDVSMDVDSEGGTAANSVRHNDGVECVWERVRIERPTVEKRERNAAEVLRVE